MSSDAIAMCELLVGLPDVNVLEVTDVDRLRVLVETRGPRPACPACGSPVMVKEAASRREVEIRV